MCCGWVDEDANVSSLYSISTRSWSQTCPYFHRPSVVPFGPLLSNTDGLCSDINSEFIPRAVVVYLYRQNGKFGFVVWLCALLQSLHYHQQKMALGSTVRSLGFDVHPMAIVTCVPADPAPFSIFIWPVPCISVSYAFACSLFLVSSLSRAATFVAAW